MDCSIPSTACCIVGLLIPTVLEVAQCVDSPILLSCGFTERIIIIRLCSKLVVEVSYTSMIAIICLAMWLGEDLIVFLGMY